MTFDNIDISEYHNVNITFDFELFEFEPADYISYEILEDNISTQIIDLPKNENGDVFVFSKNGNAVHPSITEIKEFRIDNKQEYPDFGYGEPRNFTLDNLSDNIERTNPKGKFGSGYYNRK